MFLVRYVIDIPMKAFWITYAIATTALLAFCYSFVGNFPLRAILTIGVAASCFYLVYKRKTLALQKHLIPLALLASVASVVSGFIIVLAIGLLGELLHF